MACAAVDSLACASLSTQKGRDDMFSQPTKYICGTCSAASTTCRWSSIDIMTSSVHCLSRISLGIEHCMSLRLFAHSYMTRLITCIALLCRESGLQSCHQKVNENPEAGASERKTRIPASACRESHAVGKQNYSNSRLDIHLDPSWSCHQQDHRSNMTHQLADICRDLTAVHCGRQFSGHKCSCVAYRAARLTMEDTVLLFNSTSRT